MPKTIPIHVCVVALTRANLSEVPQHFRDLLSGPGGTFDLASMYGSSPDEWAPFEEKKQITEYLAETDFKIRSLSSFLATSADARSLSAIVTKVDLYIIDPLFLVLKGSYLTFIASLDATIDNSVREGRKAFCLVHAPRLPGVLNQRLAIAASERLKLSRLAYDDGSEGAEWEANSPGRLLPFLRKLHRRLETLPSRERMAELTQMLFSLGVAAPTLENSPRMQIGI